MKQSVIVIDDFYDNPEEKRNEALESTFLDGGTYPGKDGRADNFGINMQNKLSRIVGKSIMAKSNGNYRLSMDGNTGRRHIHTDGVDLYVASVSLTRDGDSKGGTAIWRHKETNTHRMAYTEEECQSMFNMTMGEVELNIVQKDGLDESKWEQIMLIPMKFNRCIIVDGMQYHSPWPQGFGDCAENGRLTQHFFFLTV